MRELPAQFLHLLSIRREFEEALEDLHDIAYDFSAGSNGRFNDQVAKCQRIRNELIFIEQLEGQGEEE